MDGISRTRSESTFANDPAVVDDSILGETARAVGPELDTVDHGNGHTDATVSSDALRARVYDAVDALDRRTPDLGSHVELAVYGTVSRSAVAPAPISAAQGRHLAASARQMLADEPPAGAGSSPWSLAGAATCRNSEIASPRYAGGGVWKCNVFVGEAFNRAGLPFPLSAAGHYATANSLASRPDSFQRVANLNDVRPGDLVSINRRGDSGHVEIVTDVARDADGQVRTITSLAAHEDGLSEGTTTAASLVQAASAAGGQIGSQGITIDGETFRVLRPKVPPVPARELIRTDGLIKG
jgi:hypothetical protein